MVNVTFQVKKVISYVQEEIFSDWIPNLEVPKQKAARKKVKVQYLQEEIFQEWIHNLEEPKIQRQRIVKGRKSASPKVARKADYTCENYFSDWISNLTEVEVIVTPKVESKVLPKTPSQTPKVERKNSPPKRQKVKLLVNILQSSQ